MNKVAENNRKVAVTGSTGLLGGYVVAELLRCGYVDITLLVRDKSRLEKLYKTLDREQVAYSREQFRVVEVELNNPLELADALQGIDSIFHTAAVVSLSNSNPGQIISENVEITSHVVNAALESGVRLLVHTSSIAALGGMKRGKMYIDESTDLEDMSTTSPYGQSKFLSENEVWRGSTMGLKVVVVNPAVILGVGDWDSKGSMLVLPMLAKGLPFYTKGVMAYVDVRDVARAEVALSQCEQAYGERFVLACENLTFKEIITLSAEAVGRRKPFFCAGSLLIGIAWRADALWSKIVGREPLLTKSAARSSQERMYYCGEKIKRYIDFKYIPIRKTISEVLTAYKEDHNKL